ncbi:MAG TPA: Zn-ribbon domain-containing OB-fold protein [Actinomycetota bacterium]|nr:Zn-ribbon domain-containing OB-fold protein [Actinomycetota bacterium]
MTDRPPPLSTLGPTPLTEAAFRRAIGAVDFEVDARYAWDTGIAVSEFLRGLRRGVILARECRKCRRVLVPPRMFCEQCFRPTDRWVEVADTGTVNTYSICHIRWDMEPLSEPELPAVIEIDGASRGIGIMHKLGQVDPDDLAVGMAVEAVWAPEEERTGSILDIRYFRPRQARLRSGPKRPGGRKRSGQSRKKPVGGSV